MVNIVTIICLLIGIVAAVFVGIMIERTRWNKLIKDGILPCPQNNMR